MASLEKKHGKQFMPCSINFSMTKQTEILSTETSDFSQMDKFSQVIFTSGVSQPLMATASDFCPYTVDSRYLEVEGTL